MRWEKSLVVTLKEHIRTELSNVGKPESQRRLAYTLRRIRELEESRQQEDPLKRFLYVLFALNHHVRYRGLSRSQVKSLVGLGKLVLRLQGIKRTASSLDYLQGELSLALSLIYRNDGLTWPSVWEQQTAFYLAKKTPILSKGFHALCCGVHAARLGFSNLAEQQLKLAIHEGVSEDYILRARLELIRLYRLMARNKDAEIEERALLNEPNISEPYRLEIQWEQTCRTVMVTQDISPLVALVRRGRTHFKPSYVIDSFLWTRSMKTREWLLRWPKLKQFARGMKMSRRHLGTSLKAVEVLEQCYDEAIPHTLKLEHLGKLAGRATRFPTIERELLFWAAVTRWSHRSRGEGFAAFALSEYISINRRISNGKESDVFGFFSDIINAQFPSIESSSDIEKKTMLG